MAKVYEIDKRIVSEETIAAALKAYFKDKPEEEPKEKPYVFKPGDVARAGSGGGLRIIVRDFGGSIFSIDSTGYFMSSSQQQFEEWDYTKVGKLRDYLK